MTEQKTVVLGVTGCIAAYKACEVLRGLQKAGYQVKVIMTKHATEFVGPTTFHALSQFPVGVEMFDEAGDPVPHITRAKEADLFLIAPATANMIAKLAHGIADDLLSSTALACTAPLMIAPAMNEHMWHDTATQDNMRTLRARGVQVVGPATGYLACGDHGDGKLAEVDEIVAAACEALERQLDLAGKNVVITAGPTYEAIDPVRFIGNRSSGKSGYALAREAQLRGAKVTLVAGPTSLEDPYGIEVRHVTSANEMLEATREPFAAADIAIFTAAVADFRPESVAEGKIKKGGKDRLELELVPNPDILKTLAADKGDTFVVGYAAETQNVLQYAKGKLVSKNADLIVANDVSGTLGVGSADNKVWLVSQEGVVELEVMSKEALASAILDAIMDTIDATR